MIPCVLGRGQGTTQDALQPQGTQGLLHNRVSPNTFPPFSPSTATFTCITHTLLLLGVCLLFYTSCPLPSCSLEEFNLWHYETFQSQRSNLLSPTQGLCICTCFGPQCPQKSAGYEGVTQMTVTKLKELALALAHSEVMLHSHR